MVDIMTNPKREKKRKTSPQRNLKGETRKISCLNLEFDDWKRNPRTRIKTKFEEGIFTKKLRKGLRWRWKDLVQWKNQGFVEKSEFWYFQGF